MTGCGGSSAPRIDGELVIFLRGDARDPLDDMVESVLSIAPKVFQCLVDGRLEDAETGEKGVEDASRCISGIGSVELDCEGWGWVLYGSNRVTEGVDSSGCSSS
jgi:hypothetical protein